LILGVGFRGQAIRWRHSRFRGSKGCCHGKHFWLSIHGVQIGGTWRIRRNRPCAAAMRPYVKLLWPLVIYVRLCLWTDRLLNDYVHNSFGFSPNFACGSEMWSLWCLLFVRQTGSSFPILEMCGFQFRHFSGSGDHIFPQISTKSHIQIKFSNANFVFNGEWNQKYTVSLRKRGSQIYVNKFIKSLPFSKFFHCQTLR